MLQLSMNANGTPQVAQRHVEPMVYLDHWAVRMFSQDVGLARRLHAALEARDGSLAVSWINIGEFARVGDGKSIRKAEDFLEMMLPRLFFLESDPFSVIDREDAVLAGTERVLPHADHALFSEVMKLRPSTPNPITVHGLLDGISGSVLVQSGDRLADMFLHRVHALRQAFAYDAGFRASVKAGTRTATSRGRRG